MKTVNGETIPPDRSLIPSPSVSERVYPSTPNVVVKQLPCYDVNDESLKMVTVVEEVNGEWTVENDSEVVMNEVPNLSKRVRSDSDEEENDDIWPTGAISKKQNLNNHTTDQTSIEGEGLHGLRPEKNDSLDAGSLHLKSHEGKVLKYIIISSASSLNIFAHPKMTRELLKKGGFEKYLDNGIEVKGRGRSVRISIEVGDNIELSKITKLGEYDVHCWSPLSSNQHVGVVSPIHVDMDLASDFLPNVKILGNLFENTKIIDVKRLKKRGKDLELVKIVFEGTLPDKISWNHQVFSVRPYIHDPIRCYKCQLYGHGSNSCIGKIVCPYCCKNHTLGECNYKSVIGPLCFHCRKSHMSGSRECDYFKQASIMENKKQSNEISYEDCKKFYRSLNNRNLNVSDRGGGPLTRVNDRLNDASAQKNYTGRAVSNNFSQGTNRFDVLSGLDDSDNSDVVDDFYMTVDEAKSPSSSTRKRKIIKCKPKSFADTLKGAAEIERDLNSQNSTQRQHSPVLCSEYNNLISSQKIDNSPVRNLNNSRPNVGKFNSASPRLDPLNFTLNDIKNSIVKDWQGVKK